MDKCEDLLICDMAEVYHILNYRELSPSLVATLLLGLRDNSRVKMCLAEQDYNTDQIMTMLILDNLNFLSWAQTKDAEKNKNRPRRILDILKEEKAKDELQTFETPEAYFEYINNIMQREG